MHPKIEQQLETARSAGMTTKCYVCGKAMVYCGKPPAPPERCAECIKAGKDGATHE